MQRKPITIDHGHGYPDPIENRPVRASMNHKVWAAVVNTRTIGKAVINTVMQ